MTLWLKARSHIRCAGLRCVALVLVELVETEKMFLLARRSVCVNGSIEIHVVTSTSAAHPSAADGKKLQLVLAQRSAAQQRAAQPSAAYV